MIIDETTLKAIDDHMKHEYTIAWSHDFGDLTIVLTFDHVGFSILQIDEGSIQDVGGVDIRVGVKAKSKQP